MAPDIFGTPTVDQFVTCSNYALQNGHDDDYLCNAVTGVCTETNENSGWMWTVRQTQTAGNTMFANATFTDDEKKLQTLFGISFLPWNTAVYKRTGLTGNVIPMNPWNQHTIMENGMTIAKVAGIGIATFYIGKMVVRKLV
jgi:hypothetical protein